MKYHKPSFFDQFKCIGSACTDTCCAGWEIEVDETTAEGYLAEKGAFGDRLRREIGSEPGEYFFKLKNNRCPFLNKENLCDIFINLEKTDFAISAVSIQGFIIGLAITRK